MLPPKPIRLFHITAIDNLPNICESGALICKNKLANTEYEYNDIAHNSCQNIRLKKTIPDPPGGYIHDYVPFYFAPRSPMLYAIKCRKVENCNYNQDDIAHLELLLTIDNIANIADNFIFYDRNATMLYAKCYTDINSLDTEISWGLICEKPALDGYCKYFNNTDKYRDRTQQRQAEFLIKNQVPLTWFNKIGIATKNERQKTYSILKQYGINLPVEIKTDWYFLGQ